jgi:phosphopantothenoylcysteine decarboxylase/phosphopantothenate--cysteine ligase
VTGLAGRHVVLGVSGGIACYKSCTVARRLSEAGAQVDVVMTASATEFVSPVTFEALTGRSVVTSLWDPGRALDHVRMGRETDLIVVAPATAHLIARAAMGMADDFLTTLLLARRAGILLCPAMNDQMFRHQDTQANLARLKAQGMHVLGPVTGPLARGEGEGPGRMVEPEEIVAWTERLLRSAAPFAGRHVVVTAGATRERIDPIRVVTNRSSGRMGYALARAAWLRGAEVTLITGPSALPVPIGPKVVAVESTAELQDAVGSALAVADVLLMAAAPADFAPAESLTTKRKRSAGPLTLTLEPTPDVLSGTAYWRRSSAIIVGFALETGDPVPAAKEKLIAKQLDLVVANDATEEGSGPEVATNHVSLVTKQGVEALPMMAKEEVAEVILERVGTMLTARA